MRDEETLLGVWEGVAEDLFRFELRLETSGAGLTARELVRELDLDGAFALEALEGRLDLVGVAFSSCSWALSAASASRALADFALVLVLLPDIVIVLRQPLLRKSSVNAQC